MARKGLPKKYAKLGFAKGWKAFKAAKRKAGKAVKRTVKKAVKKVKRKVTKTKTKTKGVKRMAKKKKSKKSVRRKRRGGIIKGRTMNAVVDGAIVGAGALGSVVLLNQTPWVKDQASWMKALISAGAGVVGLTMFKNKMAKKAFSGMIVGSAISMALPYMPEGFKFSGGRALAPGELEMLQTGKPLTISGRPTTIPQNNLMGTRGLRSQLRKRY